MIAYVKGTVDDILSDSVIVDVQGMGYQVFSSAMDLNQIRIGGYVKLYTHMSVREDGVSLYGFLSKESLRMFQLLIGVSGVGPKVGISVLSTLSVADLQMAIISNDYKSITKANGVGTKGAQRIVMELKDKIDFEDMMTSDSAYLDVDDVNTTSTDVIKVTCMALVSLGYTQLEASKAVKAVENAQNMSEEELIKAALKKLI